MIKKRILILSILVISLLVLTLIEEHNWFLPKERVEFKRVSRFDNKGNKVFIYQISDTLWNEIRKHGKAQEHVNGKITVSFYYLPQSNKPDLTLAKDFYNAIDKGQTMECVAAAWITKDYELVKHPSNPHKNP